MGMGEKFSYYRNGYLGHLLNLDNTLEDKYPFLFLYALIKLIAIYLNKEKYEMVAQIVVLICLVSVSKNYFSLINLSYLVCSVLIILLSVYDFQSYDDDIIVILATSFNLYPFYLLILNHGNFVKLNYQDVIFKLLMKILLTHLLRQDRSYLLPFVLGYDIIPSIMDGLVVYTTFITRLVLGIPSEKFIFLNLVVEQSFYVTTFAINTLILYTMGPSSFTIFILFVLTVTYCISFDSWITSDTNTELNKRKYYIIIGVLFLIKVASDNAQVKFLYFGVAVSRLLFSSRIAMITVLGFFIFFRKSLRVRNNYLNSILLMLNFCYLTFYMEQFHERRMETGSLFNYFILSRIIYYTCINTIHNGVVYQFVELFLTEMMRGFFMRPTFPVLWSSFLFYLILDIYEKLKMVIFIASTTHEDDIVRRFVTVVSGIYLSIISSPFKLLIVPTPNSGFILSYPRSLLGNKNEIFDMQHDLKAEEKKIIDFCKIVCEQLRSSLEKELSHLLFYSNCQIGEVFVIQDNVSSLLLVVRILNKSMFNTIVTIKLEAIGSKHELIKSNMLSLNKVGNINRTLTLYKFNPIIPYAYLAAYELDNFNENFEYQEIIINKDEKLYEKIVQVKSSYK